MAARRVWRLAGPPSVTDTRSWLRHLEQLQHVHLEEGADAGGGASVCGGGHGLADGRREMRCRM